MSTSVYAVSTRIAVPVPKPISGIRIRNAAIEGIVNRIVTNTSSGVCSQRCRCASSASPVAMKKPKNSGTTLSTMCCCNGVVYWSK